MDREKALEVCDGRVRRSAVFFWNLDDGVVARTGLGAKLAAGALLDPGTLLKPGALLKPSDGGRTTTLPRFAARGGRFTADASATRQPGSSHRLISRRVTEPDPGGQH